MQIRQKYHKALEIKHRVDSDHLSQTVGQLMEICDKESSLKTFLDFNILNKQTSVIQRVEVLTGLIQEKIKQDITDVLFRDLAKYKQVYHGVVRSHLEAVRDALGDAANLAG